MASVQQKLMKQVSEVRETTAKITVVGAGQVGMAATFSMMVQVIIMFCFLVGLSKERLILDHHAKAHIP